VLVFTAAGNEGRLAGWAADGAEVVALPAGDGGLSVDAVLAELGRRRMTHVLVEGGAGVHGSFLDAGAADELHVFVAPVLIGGAAAPGATGGRGAEKLAAALQLGEMTAEPSGADVYLHAVRPADGVSS